MTRCAFPTQQARQCLNGADGVIAGLDACHAHLRHARAYVARQIWHDSRLQHEVRQVLNEIDAERRREQEKARAATLATRSVVYYLQRADGLVKIGYSSAFTSRLSTLTREHGPLAVLATHRGGRDAEAWQHRRFAHLRELGEWFWPEPELLEHVAYVNARRAARENEAAA